MFELQRNRGRETPFCQNEGKAEELLTQYWMNMTEWDYSEKNKESIWPVWRIRPKTKKRTEETEKTSKKKETTKNRMDYQKQKRSWKKCDQERQV